jgi:acylphosphatase
VPAPPPPDRARLDAVVQGRVQGVGFRFHVRETAADLGLTGWVVNERDGTVRCVAEGPRGLLERLLRYLEAGPRGAYVERVSATWSPATDGFDRFSVRSGAHSGD